MRLKLLCCICTLLLPTLYGQVPVPNGNSGGGGSGTFNQLSGDATSTATGGATTVTGLKGVPFCTGFTPIDGQALEYTTASSPNPCYTAGAAGGSFTALTGDATSTSSGGATTVVGLNNTLMSSLASGFVFNTTITGVPSTVGSTGSGNVVRATSPTLVTPILGTPTSGTLTNATGLPLTTGVTGILPSANGGTGVNNSATLTLGSSNQNWATLGSGIVKNTTTTGALSVATAGTDYSVATNGTSGQALVSNGSGGFGTPVTLGTAATANTATVCSGGTPVSSGWTSGSNNCIATSGGTSPIVSSVSYSATPTFVVTADSNPQVWTITLTGNVTSSTLSTISATTGQSMEWDIAQDGTGGRTFVFPTQVLSVCTISGIASAVTRVYGTWDGSNIIAPSCLSTDLKLVTQASSTSEAGLNVPAGSAPSSPVAGDLWNASGVLYLRGASATAQIAQTVAFGSLALATSAISGGACQAVSAGSVNSAAATGVASTDVISWTPNGSIASVTGYVPGTSGGLSIVAYPTAGYVNFDVCNWSSGSITPGSVTVNWRVPR